MLKDILTQAGLRVFRRRFLYGNHFYPLHVVVFEGGSEWGHFNPAYFQIALNRKLIFAAKDSVVADVLRHELAHYLTYIKYGPTSHHGSEFKSVCGELGFSEDVVSATMNLELSNESKEGDLDSERVIAKVKKLLQLASSSNSNEAELATLKANQLLLKYNLEWVAERNCDQVSIPIYMDRILVKKRKDAKMSAIYDILRHFIVRPVFSFGTGMCCLEISGSLANVKMAKYVAEFLDRELDQLWLEAQRHHGLRGLRAKNSFFLGVAKGFSLKMELSKSQLLEKDQHALALVEKNLEAHLSLIYRRLGNSYSSHIGDSDATEAGITKGRQLNIHPGVESQSKVVAYLNFPSSSGIK